MGFGATLMARLGLDTSGFKTGITGVESTLNQLAGKLGLGLSIAGLTAYTKDIIAYGSTIQDLAERFKISSRTLQQFGNAGELVGTSLEGVAKGFNKLEIAQSSALSGNSVLLKAFKNLGITVEDLKTLSPDQLMQKLGKSSLNAADLVKVLGKNALELRPLLKGLGDGSLELGDAIDEGLIQKLDEADDTLKRFAQDAKIVSAGILGNIAAGFKTAKNDVADIFKGVGDLISAQFRGQFASSKEEFLRAGKDAKSALDLLFRGRNEGARASGGASGKDAPQVQSDAEKKARQRELLTVDELVNAGARYGRPATEQGWHGWLGGTMATGTAQAIYEAEQARKVKDLEAQAKRVALTGVSPTGESAHQLYTRADEIRQSIGSLKDSEKQVGPWIVDESTTGRAVQFIAQEFASEGGS
jgi:hypothetical protein